MPSISRMPVAASQARNVAAGSVSPADTHMAQAAEVGGAHVREHGPAPWAM
jgi:hypothetical protein